MIWIDRYQPAFKILLFSAIPYFLASCAPIQNDGSDQNSTYLGKSEKYIKLTPEEDRLRAAYSKLSYSGLLKDCLPFANLLKYPDSRNDSDSNGVVYERALSQDMEFESAKAACYERMNLVLSSLEAFSQAIKMKGLLVENNSNLVKFIESVVAGNQTGTETIVINRPSYSEQKDYHVTQVEENFAALGNMYYYKESGDKVLNLPDLYIDTSETSVALFMGSRAPYENVVYLYKGPMKALTKSGTSVNTLHLKLYSNIEFYDYLGLDSSNLVTTDIQFFLKNYK